MTLGILSKKALSSFAAEAWTILPAFVLSSASISVEEAKPLAAPLNMASRQDRAKLAGTDSSAMQIAQGVDNAP